MIFIDSFPGKASALNFMELFSSTSSLKDTFKGEKFDLFVITQDNFDIFYKTKDVGSYLNFFEKNY